MTILIGSLPAVSTKVFSHDSTARMLFCEISTALGHREFGNVYDDACDVGLKTVNQGKGVVTVWYLDRVISGSEGDIESFILKPVKPSPKQRGYEMVLFND